MTHKEKCINHCKEALQNRNLAHTFNPDVFNSYYKKNNGFQGNAFVIGIKTADLMIEQYKPTPADLEIYEQMFN